MEAGPDSESAALRLWACIWIAICPTCLHLQDRPSYGNMNVSAVKGDICTLGYITGALAPAPDLPCFAYTWDEIVCDRADSAVACHVGDICREVDITVVISSDLREKEGDIQ